MDDVAAFQLALSQMLERSSGSDMPCPVTADEAHQLVFEYLGEYDTELALLPEVTADPHWNLWDWWDWSTNAVADTFFVAVVIEPSGLEVASGRAERWALQTFTDSEFPDDVRQVVPELARRFGLPGGSVRVDRPVAESWLGRELGLHA